MTKKKKKKWHKKKNERHPELTEGAYPTISVGTHLKSSATGGFCKAGSSRKLGSLPICTHSGYTAIFTQFSWLESCRQQAVLC